MNPFSCSTASGTPPDPKYFQSYNLPDVVCCLGSICFAQLGVLHLAVLELRFIAVPFSHSSPGDSVSVTCFPKNWLSVSSPAFSGSKQADINLTAQVYFSSVELEWIFLFSFLFADLFSCSALGYFIRLYKFTRVLISYSKYH